LNNKNAKDKTSFGKPGLGRRIPSFYRYSEAKTIQPHAENYLSDLKARGGDGRKNKGEKQIRSRREMLNKLIVYLLLLKDYLLQSTN